MKIMLIRHTSVDVPEGTCYGISDVPLASSFRCEFAHISQMLCSEEFDAVFSSPLSRCALLAAELAGNQAIQVDNRLAELDFGDWEMIGWDTIFESVPGKAWFADYVNTRCSNGESFANQIERCRSFLTDLQNHPSRQVLVITHAGIIRSIMCLLQGKTPEEAFNSKLEYGQIITINLENQEYRIK